MARPARRGRRLLVAAALAMACTAAPAQPSRAQPRPDTALGPHAITLVNRSRQPIEQLYVSPSDADQWGQDWLGDDAVYPGGFFSVQLPPAMGCNVDIQVIYADARHEERLGLDACHTAELAFNGATAAAPPAATGAEHTLTVTNRAPKSIRQLFISDPAADDWGDDRLAGEPILAGDSHDIVYHGGCTADLRVVFDNRSAEERHGIDLCAAASLAIHPGWTTEDAPVRPARAKPRTPLPATPPADTVVQLIDVTNGSAAPVTAIMLTPEAGRASQSQSLLGGQVLPRGGHTVAPFTRGAACRFTARVRHGGGVADQVIPGIDLCRNPDITIPAR